MGPLCSGRPSAATVGQIQQWINFGLGGLGLKIFSPPPLIYFLYWDPDPDPEKNQKPIRARGGAGALIADTLKNLFGPSKNFGCLIPESILKTILEP